MNEKQQNSFLKWLAETGNVTISAKKARVPRSTLYKNRGLDEEFAKSWDDAVEASGDLLEFEARRRAVEGTLKPVFHKGEEVGHIREYSDSLLTLLLKGAKPEKYRDKMQISGDEDAPLVVKVVSKGAMDKI